MGFHKTLTKNFTLRPKNVFSAPWGQVWVHSALPGQQEDLAGTVLVGQVQLAGEY